MRTVYVLEPAGWPCTLAACPPGPFFSEGNHLGFKSEYRTTDGKIEAFNEAGEFFWGGTETADERIQLIVQPLNVVKIEIESSG